MKHLNGEQNATFTWPWRWLRSCGTTLVMLLCLSACGNDDETSVNPKNRIVGKWKLVRQGSVDISYCNIYYTFSKKGELTMHNVQVRKDLESEPFITDVTIPFAFEDDWVHDEATNELHGHFAIKSDSGTGTPTPQKM